jgi:molybdopterin converting factor subunit 1
MRIQVLFFGIAAEIAEISSLDLDVIEALTVASFKNLLKKKYTQLKHLNSYAIAVNESYAADELVLKENDTIAIIPPVSGG